MSNQSKELATGSVEKLATETDRATGLTAKAKEIQAAWPGREGTTHWEGCETSHYRCAIAVLLEALEESQRETAGSRGRVGGNER
jgi:hypothetical protein